MKTYFDISISVLFPSENLPEKKSIGKKYIKGFFHFR